MGNRRGVWQNFDITDGFPGGGVMAILEDRQGDLWFGTWNAGVCRYDGMEFVTFAAGDGLPGNDVHALCQDREGHLWLGTSDGLCRYDGTEFVVFTVEDGLASNTVRALCQDQEGNLWVGAGGVQVELGRGDIPGGGVSRCDGKEFRTFTVEDGLAGKGVYALCQDREGHLWVGTDEGVSRYDGKEWRSFTAADGLAGNTVSAIGQDREGNLWVGTWTGVSRYDGQEFETFTVEDGLVDNRVWSLCADHEGNLWLGTDEGVSRYHGKGFENFTIVDGLAGNVVGAIGQDREGNLWFGTGRLAAAGSGVSRYGGAHFKTFTTRDGLVSDHVVGVLEDRKGDLWFGTWYGVSRYDGEGFHTLEGLKANVRSIVEDQQGNLWFGTYYNKGLIRWDGHQMTTYTTEDGLAHNIVEVVLEDREGHLWFGTEGGVSRYDGKGFETIAAEGNLAYGVRSICQDREGNLWFGTSGGGVCCYDGRHFKSFTTADGLPSNWVISVLQDRQGNLWLSTAEGVSRYDGKEFRNFTTADGLPRRGIMSMMEDREGYLWFCSYGGGVCRYDGLVFQTLHQRIGLAHNGAQRVLQDRRGDFWITTEEGITRYRPRRTLPAIRLTGVVADREYEPVERLTLQASQRRIAFVFRGRSYRTGRDQMAYVYRLQGYEEEWRWTRQEEVAYTDLAVGKYAFQVRAVDLDLNYSESVAIQIEVVPDYRIKALTEIVNQSGTSGDFVGDSPALRQVQAQLAQVAPTELTVLITGETGTGKGLAARTVHRLSANQAGPFIQVNCGAIPQGLVESELFGHEKGAFTGALARKLGKVELAQGGTLFLDEIGDMSLEAQVKLLRLLEERTFERVGGTQTLPAEVRVMAATNRDLAQRVAEGSFREDLYFRLQVFPVRLPPLRERREDIGLLATYFMERMAAHLSKEVVCLGPEALAALQRYAWPGNVRELEHVVQRAVVVCRERVIQVGDLGLDMGPAKGSTMEEIVTLEELERRYIREVLEKTRGVIKGPEGAAALLGLPASTLYFRMKKLGIERK